MLGVPDDEWGEVLLAIVQPRREGALDEDDVVGWVRDHMADYKRPRLVEFVAELPARSEREGAQAEAAGGVPRGARARPRRVPGVHIAITRLDPDAVLPGQAHDDDAGYDLCANEDAVIAPRGGRALVPTGLAVAIPAGCGGFVLPRSGLALKHGVTVLNAPGLIDPQYRGEVKVLLVNTDPGHRLRDPPR